MLSSDDSVFCEDSSHRALQVVSAVIIAVVAIGLPLAFGVILLRASRQYERETAGNNQEVAKRIAKELDADEDQATWVVRDVLIGRDYSVLMDAYEPKYLYCKYCSCVGVLVIMDSSQLLTLNMIRCVSSYRGSIGHVSQGMGRQCSI